MFDILDMGASGLVAQRTRMDTCSENLLNANTTHNKAGEKVPFRRRLVLLASGASATSGKPGVHVEKIEQDASGPIKRFEPGHPDADPSGYVSYPRIDMSIEYVNALEASRAYEANVTMMEVSKAMINASLRLIA